MSASADPTGSTSDTGVKHACIHPCQALRRSKHNPGKRGPTVVTKRYRALGATDYDVCVAGGTLGVFLALALQVALAASAIIVIPAERQLALLHAGAFGRVLRAPEVDWKRGGCWWRAVQGPQRVHCGEAGGGRPQPGASSNPAEEHGSDTTQQAGSTCAAALKQEAHLLHCVMRTL
jgi:hypothetical protein